MTLLGQAVHVARKDLHQGRWFLLAYAALLSIGAFLVLARAGEMNMLAGPLTVIAAWLAVGVAVQADSTTRPDAFWVTRPLSPGAVFAAKLVVIGVVIALGLGAQLIALHLHAVPLRDMLAEAGSLLLWFVGALALALVVAAVTRDTAGFLLASLGMVVLLQLVGMYLAPQPPEADAGSGPTLLGALSAALLLGVGGWQYRTRNMRRGRVVALAAVLLVGGAAVLEPATPDVVREPAVEVSGRLQVGGTTSRAQLVELYAALPAPAEAGARVLLHGSSARLHMPGGDEEDLRIRAQPMGDYRLLIASPADSPVPRMEPSLLALELSKPQLAALRDGTAVIIVEGAIVVQRARELASMALDESGVRTGPGIRLRIDTANTLPGQQVALAMTGVSGPDAPAAHGGDDLVYALTGAAAGDTLRLQRRQSGGGMGFLVLPSRRAWSQHVVLHTPDVASGEAVAWPDDARLRVSGWERVETYPVRITAALAER